MQQHLATFPDKTDDAPVLIADAAAHAGRSTSRVRVLRQAGILTACEIDGRQAVTAGSLHRFMIEAARQEAASKAKRSRPALRLVWSNPNPNK